MRGIISFHDDGSIRVDINKALAERGASVKETVHQQLEYRNNVQKTELPYVTMPLGLNEMSALQKEKKSHTLLDPLDHKSSSD